MDLRLACLTAFIFASSTLLGQPSIETPVDDIEYQRIVEYYNYDEGIPSDPVSYGEWPWRGPHVLYKISYRSVREQRVPAYLAIPKEKKSKKLPVVILMHGWNLFWGKNEDWVQQWIPILTAQGYAVLAPDHFLFGERKIEGGFDVGSNRGPYYYRDWMCQSVADLRRGIDYLLTRPDIDPERIAVFGGSLGGWIGSILSAVEPRIKTSILSVPATEFITAQTPPGRVINSSNFFPRYKDLSLLVVVAKKDLALRTARAKELFELAPVHKKLIEYDEGHFLDPQKYNKDILEWLRTEL
ncbi:MAG: alpha/beta fold hydrolase [Chlorobi bacterium]|nr:alpha/beta fold hydrolase [Chlorobiota bacterium]